MELSAYPLRRSCRRWFQFSLRTLMLVTALVAALVAWRGERTMRWAVSLWATRAEEPVDADDRYRRVEIMGPITSGGPPQALDPPTEAEILAALSGKADSRRFVERARRERGRMTVELIADYVDPPKLYPIIGRAQLHHAHYKCEVRNAGAAAVVYIDHNHFHVVDGQP